MIVRSEQLPYLAFATAFSQIGISLDTYWNTISHENLNSGSHKNCAKLVTD